jgi:hypothetical protein
MEFNNAIHALDLAQLGRERFKAVVNLGAEVILQVSAEVHHLLL